MEILERNLPATSEKDEISRLFFFIDWCNQHIQSGQKTGGELEVWQYSKLRKQLIESLRDLLAERYQIRFQLAEAA